MDEFHTFYHAVVTSTIILFTADMETYMKQQAIEPIVAALWTFLFITIM